jgi:hypothetical protein
MAFIKKPPVPVISRIDRGSISLPKLFDRKDRRSKSEWPGEKSKG